MGRLKEYYHEQLEHDPDVDDDPLNDPEQLAELLEEEGSEVDKAMLLLDGTESFVDPEALPQVNELALPQVSVEGFEEFLSKVWDAVRRFVTGVINSFTNDDKASRTANRIVGFQAENLKMESRARLVTGHKHTNHLTIQSHITALSVFYRPPGKIGDIVAGLKNMERLMVEYYDYMDRVLTPGLSRLSTQIRSMDPLSDSFTLDAQRLASELHSLSPAVVLERHFEQRGGTEMLGPHLMGNVRLAATSAPKHGSLSEVTRSRMYLRHSELTPRRMPERITLPRFNLLGSDQCLDQVLRISHLLKDRLGGNKAAKRERALNDLLHVVDRFVKRAGELDNGKRQEKDDANAIAQAVRVTTQWMSNPYQGMTTNALRSMRGALMVCRRNLD